MCTFRGFGLEKRQMISFLAALKGTPVLVWADVKQHKEPP